MILLWFHNAIVLLITGEGVVVLGSANCRYVAVLAQLGLVSAAQHQVDQPPQTVDLRHHRAFKSKGALKYLWVS